MNEGAVPRGTAGESDSIQSDKPRLHTGVWTFYAVFVFFAITEGLIVGAILAVSRLLGVSHLGPWLAYVLFILGGFVVGALELKAIDTERELKDPILRACCWLYRRFGAFGLICDAIISGALGTGVALAYAGHRRPYVQLALTSIIFASFWVPIYLFIWR